MFGNSLIPPHRQISRYHAFADAGAARHDAFFRLARGEGSELRF